MKILKLQAENIKRLHAVEIEPNGNVVVIGGKNGAGKSSCLDAIEYALGGEPAVKMPVRRGEDKAKVVLDLGDLIVRRTFTAAGGSTLMVTNADGERKLSPQAILDKLVGKLTFDPLSFSRQKPDGQAETLRQLVGLDFTEHDAKAKKLYDDRTTVNRDVKTLQARLAAAPKHDDAPAEEVSAADVLAEQQKAAEQNSANQRARQSANASALSVKMQKDSVAAVREEVKRLTEELAGQEKNLSRLVSELAGFQTACEGLQDVDLTPFRDKASKVESDNAKVRSNKARAKLHADWQAKEKEAENLTKQIDALDSERKRKTAGAKYPIDGLMFDTAGGVTLESIPFDQCSTADQLKVSVAIGLALNPTLKILLIRDGSLLDEDSMKLLSEMATKSEAQIWLEVVNPDDPTAVIIEDGQVRQRETEQVNESKT